MKRQLSRPRSIPQQAPLPHGNKPPEDLSPEMAAKLPRHAHFRGGKPAGLAHGIPAAHGVNTAQRCGTEFVVRGDGESGEAVLSCVHLLGVTAKAADDGDAVKKRHGRPPCA